jgi:alkylhydroperoxidase/carboxymuconolactone decarboxylase family protein YurZ
MAGTSAQAKTASTNQLLGLAGGDLSVIDNLMKMHEGTLEASHLDPRSYSLVRIAALATLDAAPVSWLTHLALSDEAGVSPEQIVGTLIAIAPVIGTARIVTAARGILGAMGLAVDLEEASRAKSSK